MDKLINVIDLDKVLDELEFCDNNRSDCARVEQSPPLETATLASRVSLSSNGNTDHFSSYFQLHADSSTTFDEHEADFAIHTRPPKILTSFASQIVAEERFSSSWTPKPATTDSVPVSSSHASPTETMAIHETSLVDEKFESEQAEEKKAEVEETEMTNAFKEEIDKESINTMGDDLQQVEPSSSEEKLVDFEDKPQEDECLILQDCDRQNHIDDSSIRDLQEPEHKPEECDIEQSSSTNEVQNENQDEAASIIQVENVEPLLHKLSDFIAENIEERKTQSNVEEEDLPIENEAIITTDAVEEVEKNQEMKTVQLVDATQLTNDQIDELSEDILDLYLNDLSTEDIDKEIEDKVGEAIPSSAIISENIQQIHDNKTADEVKEKEEEDKIEKVEEMIQVTEIVDVNSDEEENAHIDDETPQPDELCQSEESHNVQEEISEEAENTRQEDSESSSSTLVANEENFMEQMSQRPVTSDLDRLQNQQIVTAPPNATIVPHPSMLAGGQAPSSADYRGGLVQNIGIFERQEMPHGLTEEEHTLGKLKPVWMADEEAPNCLHCDSKFTMIKRRHHCRSCGKVLCGQCCNYKAKLAYLEGKEARVCQLCYTILMRIEEIERIHGPQPIDGGEQHDQDQQQAASSSSLGTSVLTFPNPNHPMEYCSTVPPPEQAKDEANRPAPCVMVPIGVLKRPERSNMRRPSEGSSSETTTGVMKQVIFSDGVRPGGDLVEEPSTSSSRLPSERPVSRSTLHLKSPPIEKANVSFEQAFKRLKSSRVHVADHKGENLPPIVNYNELKMMESSIPSKPSYAQLLTLLRNSSLPWITFGMTKNLFLTSKIVSKSCCGSTQCWSFVTRGLTTVGHDEVMVNFDCDSLVDATSSDECLEETIPFPRDIFRLVTTIYDSASKATVYSELSHIFFPDGLFGNKENSGFIFVRPTLQCFVNLQPPSPPFLIALLIHKWEIPWAKVFPLRLVLRLGFQYGTYPTPVISYPNRKSVYYEIGHTIMNVLADFRNFQYTLSAIEGLVVHVEENKRATMIIPKASYEKACKALSTSNEHVLAFGGNFSTKADSHLVCIQNEQDDDVHNQYRTEVAGLPGTPKQLTAANFIVFSGALKSSTGLKAKMNTVEDGLLVQIPPSAMEELRAAIRDMKDYKIHCCPVADNDADEWVQIVWANEELCTNLGVRSQIDATNLEGVQSARIFSSPDYTNERYLIRWIEVFLLQINENSPRLFVRSEMLNTSRLAESLAQAFCVALINQLDQLHEAGLTKIGLRVSLDADKVGYEAGSNGQALPAQYSNELDGALIPVIMENVSSASIEDPLVIELLFCVLLK